MGKGKTPRTSQPQWPLSKITRFRIGLGPSLRCSNGRRVSALLCQTSKQFQYLLLQKSHQTRSEERQRANGGGSSRFITIPIAAAAIAAERERGPSVEKRGAMQRRRRGEEVIDPNSFRAPTGNSEAAAAAAASAGPAATRPGPSAENQRPKFSQMRTPPPQCFILLPT